MGTEMDGIQMIEFHVLPACIINRTSSQPQSVVGFSAPITNNALSIAHYLLSSVTYHSEMFLFINAARYRLWCITSCKYCWLSSVEQCLRCVEI